MRRVILLVALTGSLVAAMSGRAWAQGDPWGGAELAYVGPDGRVYVTATDGREPRPVSSLRERAQFPSWSPDGRRLAAIASNGRQGRLFVVDGDGRETELYRADGVRAPIYHAWSPTSEAVAFLANAPETGLELHVASVASTGDDADPADTRVAGGSPFYFDWTADGAGLWIHSGFHGADARFGRTDAFEDTLETNIAAPGFFQAPDLSTDGTWLAYSAESGSVGAGVRRLTLEPVDDGMTSSSSASEDRPRRQLQHEGLVAFAWSPTDDVLAFTAPLTPVARSSGPLQLLDAADGFVRPLVEATVLAFFWSPDGRSIATITSLGGTPGGGGVAGTPSGSAGAMQVQQRGLPLLQVSLIDVAGGAVRAQAPFAPTPTWLGQFLPFFDQYARSHRIWSPDGRAIVLPMRDADGVSRVTVVGIDGATSILGAGDMPFWR